MDDNFSPRVKDVISFSKEEALRLGHDFIGTEHLMLGLLRDGNGKAIDILNALDVDLSHLRRKVEITQNTISFKFGFHTKTILRCDIQKIRFFYVKYHGHAAQYSHNKILFNLQNRSYIYIGEFSKQVIEGMKIKEVGLSTYKRFRKTKKL